MNNTSLPTLLIPAGVTGLVALVGIGVTLYIAQANSRREAARSFQQWQLDVVHQVVIGTRDSTSMTDWKGRAAAHLWLDLLPDNYMPAHRYALNRDPGSDPVDPAVEALLQAGVPIHQLMRAEARGTILAVRTGKAPPTLEETAAAARRQTAAVAEARQRREEQTAERQAARQREQEAAIRAHPAEDLPE